MLSLVIDRTNHVRPQSRVILYLQPISNDVSQTTTTMAKAKKVKAFKFTITQSEWLEKFLDGYRTVVKNDPDDSANTLAPFLDDIFTKLENEYSVVSESSPREKVIEVGSHHSNVTIIYRMTSIRS